MNPFEQAQLCKKRKETEEDVITIDDEEPLPPPTPEVLELREKLAKADDLCQRAIRAAEEAEARAQFAEALLDSNRNVVEEAAKLDDVVNNYNAVLIQENAQLRRDLYEAEGSVVAATTAKDELTRERIALRLEIHRLKGIAAQFEEDRKLERMRDQAKFLELQIKFTKLAKAVDQEQAKKLQTPQRSTLAVRPPAATATISPLTSSPDESMDVSLPDNPRSPGQAATAPTNFHDINDPINLFRLCPRNEPAVDSVIAKARLHDMFSFGMLSKWKVHCANSTESYACGLCQDVVSKADVFEHYFTQRHGILVHSRRGKVSQAALNYWKDQLQLADSPMPGTPGATARVDLSTALAAAGHKVLTTAAAARAAATSTPTAAPAAPTTAAAAVPTAVAGMANGYANSDISEEI